MRRLKPNNRRSPGEVVGASVIASGGDAPQASLRVAIILEGYGARGMTTKVKHICLKEKIALRINCSGPCVY